MSFKRGLKIKQALDIGIKYLFWFGDDNSGIAANDGMTYMWIDAGFLESINGIEPGTSYINFIGAHDETGEFCGETLWTRYTLHHKIYNDKNKRAYKVLLFSGFSSETIKSLYNQLYNHLLEKI